MKSAASTEPHEIPKKTRDDYWDACQFLEHCQNFGFSLEGILDGKGKDLDANGNRAWVNRLDALIYTSWVSPYHDVLVTDLVPEDSDYNSAHVVILDAQGNEVYDQLFDPASGEFMLIDEVVFLPSGKILVFLDLTDSNLDQECSVAEFNVNGAVMKQKAFDCKWSDLEGLAGDYISAYDSDRDQYHKLNSNYQSVDPSLFPTRLGLKSPITAMHSSFPTTVSNRKTAKRLASLTLKPGPLPLNTFLNAKWASGTLIHQSR